ncbi:MAG: hypothetical protein ACREOZ_01300, partial [Gloeomargaritales cyanobacterium]
MILTSLAHTQLAAGIGTQILNADYKKYKYAQAKTWLDCIWQFLYEMNATIECSVAWRPEKQCDNDSFLMQTFASQFTAAEAQTINQCRMFLQVVTVADIATGDGRTVGKTYIEWKRDEHRISNYSWPIQ